MNTEVLLSTLGIAFSFVFVLVVVWLSLWARGRAPLSSPLWVVAYIVLSGGVSLITAPALQNVVKHYTPVFGWTVGTLLFVLGSIGSVAGSFARCLLAMLVSSDVVYLVSAAGFDSRSRFGSCLLPVRKHHILFGASALVFTLITPLTIGLLWMRT